MNKENNIFILDRSDIKLVSSKNYNFTFDKVKGIFFRWGQTKEDNPIMSPLGPEIVDIEISTICKHNCSWCYKSNNTNGYNMSFNTFKKIFHLLKTKNNSALCQIAFGVGSLEANPDLWEILKYTKDNGIVPNITVNGRDINEENAHKLAKVCGAISVSRYDNTDYDAIKILTGTEIKQINLHQLLSKETYQTCLTLIKDINKDERLSGLNALTFLLLKPKGKRNIYTNISIEEFNYLLQNCIENNINIGFDSCSAPLVLKYAEKNNRNDFIQSIEPCESTLFSMYVSVNAKMYPCSFCEGTIGWEKGIDLLEAKDFLKDVWYHPKTQQWRNNLLKSSQKCDCLMKEYCKSCPIYQITPCRKNLLYI